MTKISDFSPSISPVNQEIPRKCQKYSDQIRDEIIDTEPYSQEIERSDVDNNTRKGYSMKPRQPCYPPIPVLNIPERPYIIQDEIWDDGCFYPAQTW